jgi:hypothetical protein
MSSDPPAGPGAGEETTNVLTGIPAVDETLAPWRDSGGVVLVAGSTGRGKTVLAVQIAVNCCRAGVPVAFLSSDPETDQRNFMERGFSAACDTPYEKLVNGGLRIGIPGVEGAEGVPSLKEVDPEFSAKALKVYNRLSEHLQHEVDAHLAEDVAGRLALYLGKLKPMPSVLVIDWINSVADAGDGSKGSIRAMHDRIYKAMELLQAIARKHRMLVFVFAQASPGKAKNNVRKVRPQAIAEFPKLVDYADAFIGISGLGHRQSEGGGDQSFSKDQYFNVVIGADESLVPVRTEFAYQRFVPRAEERRDDLRDLGKRIERAAVHRGWVRMPRNTFSDLLKIKYPAAINVYVLLLLMAEHDDGEAKGTCFLARRKAGELLGFSPKIARTALEKLEDAKLIERVEAESATNRYRICGYKEMQGEKCKYYYYFLLFRNIRDEERKELFGNQELLRLWLWCLNEARYNHDEDGEIERGDFELRPARIAADLGMKTDAVEGYINTLKGQGRVELRDSDWRESEKIVRVVNWQLYQDGYVFGGSRQPTG